MYVVALLNPPPFSPGAARRLAAVLSVPPMQAAGCLQVPGRGPVVVASYEQARRAEQLLALLKGAGFESTILGPEPPASPPIEVAALGLDDWVLTLESTARQRRVIVCDDVAAIIWGNRVREPIRQARDVVWQTEAERHGLVWLYSVQGDVAHIEEAVRRRKQAQPAGVSDGGSCDPWRAWRGRRS